MPDSDDKHDKEDISFKVRDKRQFNPDGSLREETEEQKATEMRPDQSATDKTPASPAPAEKNVDQSAGSHLEPDRPSSPSSKEQHVHEGGEPLEFINFIYGLASNAFANLGMMPHPVSGEATVDLETAKHFINIIGLLEKKTKGNLSDQESKIVAEILRDLRMQYVSLLNAPKL